MVLFWGTQVEGILLRHLGIWKEKFFFNFVRRFVQIRQCMRNCWQFMKGFLWQLYCIGPHLTFSYLNLILSQSSLWLGISCRLPRGFNLLYVNVVIYLGRVLDDQLSILVVRGTMRLMLQSCQAIGYEFYRVWLSSVVIWFVLCFQKTVLQIVFFCKGSPIGLDFFMI